MLAGHNIPPMLQSQYHLNAAGPQVLPTPPVATRKRKRAHQYTVSYSEVQEVDSDGRLREVIVIEDTPPPPTTMSPSITNNAFSASYQPPLYSAPIRTRARAAAEAQALSTSSSSAIVAPPAKKRKREAAEEVRAPAPKRTAVSSQQSHAVAQTKSWDSRSAAATDDTSKGPVSCDDKEGHYIIVPDDMIYRRYRTVKLLGQGTFGKVVEAVDTQTDTKVAIKIIRAIPKYRDASKIEVRVLNKLKEPNAYIYCIGLTIATIYALSRNFLGMCLYDFLKDNDFAPFPRQHIQSFARQLLGSVAFLHDLHLIHTDLKPENILLVHNDYKTVHVPVQGKVMLPQFSLLRNSDHLLTSQRNAPPKAKRILHSTDIRLIDFGSATFENEYHSTVVCTRHYRAPEIILGLGWSYPCDAYSLGCILVEFFTGIALFQTHDNLEHLAMMEMVMGKMPERFARAGARSKPEFFKENARLDWPKAKASRQSKKEVRATRPLSDVIPPHDLVNRHFLNLVQKLLAFDPAQRITVREALAHPYFTLIIANEI
ncbi:Dual specificity protein kinase lkh1 [Mycena venus]|uniref:Dual specificity protein kinase lkh1 n=1 Tax=Mycena venus TaxID=2733690 RepID=A0A8H6WX63_9AGAR|nr:Dual specificity protein kinase lkh1 [Mycena venus]